MRRWPLPVRNATIRAVVPLQTGFREEPGLRQQRPVDQGDIIEPWCVSGGLSCWPNDIPFPVTPAFDGVQLLCHVYIPDGHVGFVKGIKVAPFKPSMFASSSVFFPAPPADPQSGVPDPNSGFWETPFGWECYAGIVKEQIHPSWFWHLRFINGPLDLVRSGQNIPPFSALDVNSWLLVPNLPVPRAGYPFGIPGSSPGFPWARQRMQRLGKWEESQVHIPVPGNTTVCLFAEWRQVPMDLEWVVVVDDVAVSPFESLKIVHMAAGGGGGFPIAALLPLLPSFGQLIGYSQPNNRTVAQRAAREGWQS